MGLGTRLAELLAANKSIAFVTSGDLRDTQNMYPNYINKDTMSCNLSLLTPLDNVHNMLMFSCHCVYPGNYYISI